MDRFHLLLLLFIYQKILTNQSKYGIQLLLYPLFWGGILHMSAFAFIKKKLLSTIDSIDSDRAKFVNSEKAFTRNRKIRFKDVLLFLLSLEQNSLNKELLEFYSYSPSSPSSSAMLQQRAKISPSVFPVYLILPEKLDLSRLSPSCRWWIWLQFPWKPVGTGLPF